MAFERAFRTLLAGALALLLASCGGGSTVVSDFRPTRVVVFGDAMADMKLGAGGTALYTINGDGTVNNWVRQLASHYSLTPLDANVKAKAHARITSAIGATGVAATSVTSQIAAWAGGFTSNDLVIVSAGTSDLIFEGNVAVVANTSAAQSTAVSNVRQAARELATQVRQLVSSGAQHVVVLTPYNMGKTPWASSVSSTGFLETLSDEFYIELVYNVSDLSEQVLVVDSRVQLNGMVNSASYSGLSVACTPTAAGVGIGIGTGKVDASLCNAATAGHLVAGYDANKYLFADPVYPTPLAHRELGEYAYSKLRVRW
ncbi:MAG: SGNH/GDSL hydrolase family protein [Ramlibacter sp.]|uniref:SGNH/GDSL hydrolase family protein n=1 Tax=Ramlibacter sp. TaxID=1917967 RepID=UPI0026282D75|nr:SGNH/GDSL hydrolase family protein [Ramlibacter sp.]MDH4377530.1 SGNH/GDSL hydrolase family protein [Ramlibacter sp.]